MYWARSPSKSHPMPCAGVATQRIP
jgi:hypothetical protein